MENLHVVELDENNFHLLGIVNAFIICADVTTFSAWESNYPLETSGTDLVRTRK